MESSSRIKFNIAFVGDSYDVPGSYFSKIVLFGPKENVYASSPGHKMLERGHLKWSIPSKNDSLCSQIALTAEVAKRLMISVIIVNDSEDGLSRQRDSVITARPEFEAGMRYLIKVKYSGGLLTTTFEKCLKSSPRPSAVPIEVAEGYFKELKQQLSALGIGAASPGFRGWEDMTVAYSRSHREGTIPIDSLPILKLQELFDDGVVKLKEARIVFSRAVESGVNVMGALANKQQISKTIIDLEAALNRKGIFPGYKDSL